MSGDSISAQGATLVDANKEGFAAVDNFTSAATVTENYAGDVGVTETWSALRDDAKAVLIDVRSGAEWNFVGVPDLATIGKECLFVAWKDYPGMALNTRFVDDVAAHDVPRDAALYLLCRSGVRSKAAAVALTAAGYGPCHNVVAGFEGDADAVKHRGLTGGWKVAGLPWLQS